MYEDLLDILKEQGTVSIEVNVTTSAVRKGVEKAISRSNRMNAMLGMPTEERRVSVVTDTDSKASTKGYTVVTVSLTDEPVAHNFKQKAHFKIVGDSDGET